MFVSFEGIEGSGKSSQVAHLRDYLEQTAIPCTFTREPGGTQLGERLRELFIDPLGQMSPEAETLLLSATRAQLVHEVIQPALRRGHLVVCDRFWLSTLAYQGYARGLPKDQLFQVTWFATGGLNPDLTLLLDLPVEKMQERLGERRGTFDRLESEGVSFHQKVRDGYLRLAEAAPHRIVVLDATKSETELEIEIRELVMKDWWEHNLIE